MEDEFHLSSDGHTSLPDSTNCFKSEKYKIVLVGDGGTGKSSYVARLQSENYRKEYIATLGVEKHEIVVSSTHGTSTVVIWDTAGQEKLGPLRDSYYTDANAAIIFFDVTSKVTYKNVPSWHKDIHRVKPDIPVVLCANKVDINERKVKSKSISYPKKHKMGFFEISVKERLCLKEPLQYLLQQLTKEPDLSITDSLEADIFGGLNNMHLQK